MKPGILRESLYERSVYVNIKNKHSMTKSGHGVMITKIEDIAVAMSSNVVFEPFDILLDIQVTNCINKLVSAGARPLCLSAKIIMPQTRRENEVRTAVRMIENISERHQIDLNDIKVEITAGNEAYIDIDCLGRVITQTTEESLDKEPKDIIMVGFAALGGTRALLKLFDKKLKTEFRESFLLESEYRVSDITVDYNIASELEYLKTGALVRACGEGGIFGEIEALALDLDMKADIFIKDILLLQDTIEIGNFLGVNPYMLESTGCVIIAAENGEEIADWFTGKCIPAALIGKLDKGSGCTVINEDITGTLQIKTNDELYRIMYKQ